MQDLYDVSYYFISRLNREHIRDFLRNDPFRTQMTILLGQRGVGKTTVIIQYIAGQFEIKKESPFAMYLPVDHIVIGGRTLYEIAQKFQESGGQLICFDEIHKYENWSQELKSIHDTFPDLKVIASGSSVLKVQKASHDLSRRAIVRYLPGLSFREYCVLKLGLALNPVSLGDIVTNHRQLALEVVERFEDKGVSILSLFSDYLKKGYYPYFFQYKNKEDYFLALEQSALATVENDLSAVYPTITGAAIKKIWRLLSFIAQQVPFKPTLSKLTAALDIGDERVLKTYLKYLEDAEIINVLSKSGKRLSVLEKPEKIYLNNTNQSYAFGDQSVDKGNLRETFFFNAVLLGHDVTYPEAGDFNVNGMIFEVGGKNKTFDQIKHLKASFLALDDVEVGFENTIPLWLFGFLH